MAAADGFSIAATVVLLFPMIYFAIATLTFFLARMSDPVATWLLRGLFKTYFRVVTVFGLLGVAAFAMAGKPGVTLGFTLFVILALVAGRFFIQRMDAQIAARDAGNPHAARSIRRLHVGGVTYNLVLMAVIIGCTPYMLPSPN